jgi:hypothetical protein
MPLMAADSFTVRVYPTPVVAGGVCRVALSSPVSNISPMVLFQGQRYPMRSVSSQVYAARISTQGLVPGSYTGEIFFEIEGVAVRLPFVSQIAKPVSASVPTVERVSRDLVLDSKAEMMLKMNALEEELDRVAIEKETLEQRLNALAKQSEETSDKAFVEKMRDDIVALEKQVIENKQLAIQKEAALSQAWELLASEKEGLRITEHRLQEKEKALYEKETMLASQNSELGSRAEVLKQWEGSLQRESVALGMEKNKLRDANVDLHARQLALQEQRVSIDAQSTVVQAELQALRLERDALRVSQESLRLSAASHSEIVAADQRRLAEKESTLVVEMTRLEKEKEAHHQLAAVVSQNAEALEIEKQRLLAKESQVLADESRLLCLYQDFQSKQERFFGLADQLQSRMLALETWQQQQQLQSDALSLRLSQLEKINEGLLSEGPAENLRTAHESDKKKTTF